MLMATARQGSRRIKGYNVAEGLVGRRILMIGLGGARIYRKRVSRDTMIYLLEDPRHVNVHNRRLDRRYFFDCTISLTESFGILLGRAVNAKALNSTNRTIQLHSGLDSDGRPFTSTIT